MKFFCKTLFVVVLLFSLSVQISAQKANEVTMPVQLSLPPSASFNLAGTDIRLSLVEGKGAEQIITPTSVGKMWLNYSSIVGWNSSNSICVSLSSGNLPAEVAIKLTAGTDVGAGSGKVGRPVGPVILTNYPQVLIAGIGSCYTGQGINKGHQLSFSWSIRTDFETDILSLSDLDLEVGIIYTIISDE